MMSNGRDGLFEGILMYTYESVEALRWCIRVSMFMSRFEMILLHPYESAEALCRKRNKVSLLQQNGRQCGPIVAGMGQP